MAAGALELHGLRARHECLRREEGARGARAGAARSSVCGGGGSAAARG
eukprot:CAMPEP_0170144416 /NCGR_PEP_ID=MMETSP0033_2-20121228/13462_1 /TAXON_ID=195969 /ORGANISM="Dolichomastix tenuilepis, Strain CCMP3274" /LENGTH=47 /DNA_ID= /DNA_START= /DNA_END= /DNA_ORIENTATION=